MAAIDTAAVVAEVAAQAVPVTVVGLAVLNVWIAVKAFRWVRQVLMADDHGYDDDDDEWDENRHDWDNTPF